MAGDDDDGRVRTGTVWTATAHAITAVIGTGVLALPWSVAQMGWILGPLCLFGFAYITYYTATLLLDCYRTPDPIKGKRNPTYMAVVRACLGAREVVLCGIVQYALLWGGGVGYTITAATSMMSIRRSECYHEKGENARCSSSGTWFMVIYGAIEIILSQIPSLEKLSLLSVVASTMSFGYSFIGLYLCAAKLASGHEIRGSLTGYKVGRMDISMTDKIWHEFQALGNIAFAYTYAVLLIEIQDTLKSPPPENKTMKRATLYSIGVTTLFYVSLGCVGYAAFGDVIPGNILTGFHKPFWLVDIANVAIVIHLIGAYQVLMQPIFAFYERWIAMRWPNTSFIHTVYTIQMPCTKLPSFQFTICKILLRTVVVVLTTLVAMMLPFFNAVLGFLGALAFWPLTVYFPLSMCTAQAKIKRRTRKWVVLQSLSLFALVVSLLAAVGSVADIIDRLKHATLFRITL